MVWKEAGREEKHSAFIPLGVTPPAWSAFIEVPVKDIAYFEQGQFGMYLVGLSKDRADAVTIRAVFDSCHL